MRALSGCCHGAPASKQVANMRMPTAAGTAFPGTAGNGMGNGDVRPMTSVRGAGYSSGPAGGGGGAKPVFDPFQQGGMAVTQTTRWLQWQLSKLEHIFLDDHILHENQ